MGEYIPPSELPINRPPRKPTRAEVVAARARETAQTNALRATAQAELPAMIGRLFSERQDLISIVDVVHPSLRMNNSNKIVKPAPRRETLIELNIPHSLTYYALEGTISEAIVIDDVHPQRFYSRGRMGFQDTPGSLAGYYTRQVGVLVTGAGLVRYPSDARRQYQVKQKAEPLIIEDKQRACLVASQYDTEVPANGYQYAHILVAHILPLLEAGPEA